MSFKTEEELMATALSSHFVKTLIAPGEQLVFFERELRGLFGIPDLVVATYNNGKQDIRAIAFEMKLSKWKTAFVQAYRYRSFANQSYVMLDKEHIKPALSNLEQFVKVNIGLLSIDESGEVNVHYNPIPEYPFCTNLRSKFKEMVFEKMTCSQST